MCNLNWRLATIVSLIIFAGAGAFAQSGPAPVDAESARSAKPAATATPIDKKAKITAAASATQTQTTAEEAAALAKKLSNPVSSLISLPLQNNFDFGMGPTGDGFRYTLNVQPVIPITLNQNWNLISRTIIPIMGQKDVVAKGSSEFGLGDTTQAFFFSPNKTEPVIWAVGPQVMISTATNKYLGTKKLSVGPTFLVLKQQGPWSVGTLIGHFLVDRREQFAALVQHDQLPAFCLVFDKNSLDLHRQRRVHLRLDREAVERPVPHRGSQACAIRQAASELRRVAAMLVGKRPNRADGVRI